MVMQKDSTNTGDNTCPRSSNPSTSFQGKFLNSGYGSFSQIVTLSEFTDGGGASGTLVLTDPIPIGAVFQQSMMTDVTGFIGDTTAVITVGDGTDVDRYNTGTPSVFTTDTTVSLGAPSGTAYHDAAIATITLTVTGGADFTSITAGQLTIHMVYFTPEL